MVGVDHISLQRKYLFKQYLTDDGSESVTQSNNTMNHAAGRDAVSTSWMMSDLNEPTPWSSITRSVPTRVIRGSSWDVEECLTRAAKQEAPANEGGPYYRTGNANLDTAFHSYHRLGCGLNLQRLRPASSRTTIVIPLPDQVDQDGSTRATGQTDIAP